MRLSVLFSVFTVILLMGCEQLNDDLGNLFGKNEENQTQREETPSDKPNPPESGAEPEIDDEQGDETSKKPELAQFSGFEPPMGFDSWEDVLAAGSDHDNVLTIDGIDMVEKEYYNKEIPCGLSFFGSTQKNGANYHVILPRFKFNDGLTLPYMLIPEDSFDGKKLSLTTDKFEIRIFFRGGKDYEDAHLFNLRILHIDHYHNAQCGEMR